jgi:hypothetical protein
VFAGTSDCALARKMLMWLAIGEYIIEAHASWKILSDDYRSANPPAGSLEFTVSYVVERHGWLIFALPAGEVAFHPHERNNKHELFFMCDDLKKDVATLIKKGVHVGETSEERWGTRTTIALPGGGEIGLYEPKHPVTFGMKATKWSGAKSRKNRSATKSKVEKRS